MKFKNVKPALVPTLGSARVLLWTLVYLLVFGALLAVYIQYDALSAAREELARPVRTPVHDPLFNAVLPSGWQRFSHTNGVVTAFRKAEGGLPVLQINATRDPAYAYRALDVNPAVGLRILNEFIGTAGLDALDEKSVLVSKASEQMLVKPGVKAFHMLFDACCKEGMAVIFYVGDIRYVIWALWSDGDLRSARQAQDFRRHFFERLELPVVRELIERPVVNSGLITAELNSRVMEQAEREFALWKLFAARASAEPEAALLPALTHYREYLRLLSSVRQETQALESDDFDRYCQLVEARRDRVEQWFVRLDKLVAMRDWEAARRQADWIIRHATLVGELLERRRAAEILERRIPRETPENGKGGI